MRPVETFDLRIFFTGRPSVTAQKALERDARAKLERDLDAAGYAPLPETFRVAWEDPRNGKATIAGLLNDPERARRWKEGNRK